jgi:hypothetical protein
MDTNTTFPSTTGQPFTITVSTMHTLTPQALAEAVAAEGLDAHADAVAWMVADATSVGICELLASITLDPLQPTVARERAFGRLVVAYSRAIERQATLDAQPAGDRFTVAA